MDIAQWPFPDEHRERFNQLRQAYAAFPLPARDREGRLVAPTQYERRLVGATVSMTFTCSTTPARAPRTSRLCLIAREMRILDERR